MPSGLLCVWWCEALVLVRPAPRHHGTCHQCDTRAFHIIGKTEQFVPTTRSSKYRSSRAPVLKGSIPHPDVHQNDRIHQVTFYAEAFIACDGVDVVRCVCCIIPFLLVIVDCSLRNGSGHAVQPRNVGWTLFIPSFTETVGCKPKLAHT